MSEDHLSVLLRAVAGGSRKDFRMLVQASSPKLMGILVTMLRDRDAARDALQVTLTRVWLRAATFDPARGPAGAWMAQIARNHAIDILRRRKRRAEVQPEEYREIGDGAPTPERWLEQRGELRKMLGCLETLEPRKAEAVRLCYLQGLSYADLAERMAAPLNTIRTWLRRGLAALRECIDDE
jgi:RNA polymerase sigma-70 factor (ECF subfamily)